MESWLDQVGRGLYGVKKTRIIAKLHRVHFIIEWHGIRTLTIS